MFVHSDHAGDKQTQWPRTGVIIFLSMSPIVWFWKKQATIETSMFGAEFVAMKQGIEFLRWQCYKLRMMGVAISGPSYIYGDNMSVIHNTQHPESVLKKKLNAICYRAIREAVAMGKCLTGHMFTHDYPAAICTKVIPGGRKRNHLVGLLLHDLADDTWWPPSLRFAGYGYPICCWTHISISVYVRLRRLNVSNLFHYRDGTVSKRIYAHVQTNATGIS